MKPPALVPGFLSLLSFKSSRIQEDAAGRLDNGERSPHCPRAYPLLNVHAVFCVLRVHSIRNIAQKKQNCKRNKESFAPAKRAGAVMPSPCLLCVYLLPELFGFSPVCVQRPPCVVPLPLIYVGPLHVCLDPLGASFYGVQLCL